VYGKAAAAIVSVLLYTYEIDELKAWQRVDNHDLVMPYTIDLMNRELGEIAWQQELKTRRQAEAN